MHRRDFLSSGLALSATAATGAVMPPSQTPATREFYELRRYHLSNGPQPALAEAFFTKAVITADLRLANDQEFLAAAHPFWAAPATAPPFLRVESSLLLAFEGWPKLIPPKQGTTGKRLFQLRTYESPSPAAHIRKVEMFNHGEFDIFAKSGFGQVFYGDTLIGAHLPNLTYLLVFNDQADLDACWNRFRTDPAWARLSHDPRYSYEEIVSNITNLILSPLPCSQI